MTKIMLKNYERLGCEGLELGIDKDGLYLNSRVPLLGYGLIATAKAKKEDIGLTAQEILKKYGNCFIFLNSKIQYLYA